MTRTQLEELAKRLEAHAAVEANDAYGNSYVENLCSEAAAAIRPLLAQEHEVDKLRELLRFTRERLRHYQISTHELDAALGEKP